MSRRVFSSLPILKTCARNSSTETLKKSKLKFGCIQFGDVLNILHLISSIIISCPILMMEQTRRRAVKETDWRCSFFYQSLLANCDDSLPCLSPPSSRVEVSIANNISGHRLIFQSKLRSSMIFMIAAINICW